MLNNTFHSDNISDLLEKYKNKQPEIVFEWNDSLSDAKGWIVINSLKNGAAGGGTRMRKGLTKEEVISLAKVMEIKFSISGPPIGGAKSGIDFDPFDPQKEEVLKRWYTAAYPILKNYYGTGGDLNVDELKDVIPITEDLGLWHPQEGIVNGHLGVTKGEKINLIGQLRFGCAKILEDKKYTPSIEKKYAVADMITGWGVSESIRHFYELFYNESLKDKRVIVQGWGNVASAAAYYQSQAGAKIVGIIDRSCGIISEVGLNYDEVKHLFLNKNGNELHSKLARPFEEINEKIWDIPADIFIPGAASKLIAKDQIFSLIDKGLNVVSCGANVPFVDDDIFFGKTADLVDNKISMIPDFIANCGMARVFAYLMQPEVEMTDKSIFEDVSNVIKNIISKIYNIDNKKQRIASKALKEVIKNL